MATTATTLEFRQEFDRKIEIVTAGLPPIYSRLLRDKIPRQYAMAIIDYITKCRSQSIKQLSKGCHKVPS